MIAAPQGDTEPGLQAFSGALLIALTLPDTVATLIRSRKAAHIATGGSFSRLAPLDGNTVVRDA
jgi:hypothetical protein